MTATMLDAALEYATRGFYVFPIRPRGKKPPLVKKGFHDATTAPATIKQWWTENPDANVAIACAMSGIVVIDIDPRNGGDKTFASLVASLGKLPATAEAVTGGGGRHLVCAAPTDAQFKGSLGPGIDIKFEGYIITPPSIHPSGNPYRWIRSLLDQMPAEPPAEWLAAMVKPAAPRVAAPAITTRAATGCTPYGRAALAAELEAIRTAPEGARNTITNEASFKLASLCAGDELEDCRDDLVIAAMYAGLDEREARKTVESGWQAGMKTPRKAPAREGNDPHVARGLPAVAACIGAAAKPEQGEPVKADIDGAIPKAVPAVAVPPPWPTMDNGAFYGPLGEAARLIEPLTEADSAAVLVHLLVAFGSAVGRGPRLVMGSIRQTANLFAVIVGKSSKARKGTAWANAREIICPADEAWAKDRIKSGLSSGEGVIHAVRDPVFKKEPIREGGKKTGKIIDYQKVEEDAGESDKRLLVIEPEFARTLKAASRRENTLSPVLREAWDSGSLSTMTKSPCKATGAHVCIVGHITKDELKRELSACDSVNGYANRFLWCCSRRARELPFGERPVREAAASAMANIQRAVTWARANGDDFVISMDAGARELWKAGYSRLSADRPGLVGSVLGRAEAQVLRLALVYALADESGTVKRPHLEAALALWRFAEDSARHIFGDALGDSVADEILRVLRESPEGMTREAICDHFNRHTPAPRLTEALRLLAENALANFIKEPARGGFGRPAERWFAVSPSGEESEESEVSGTPLGSSLASLASRAPAGETNSPTTRTAATNIQGDTDAEKDAV